jgi:hypothetical protein
MLNVGKDGVYMPFEVTGLIVKELFIRAQYFNTAQA